jgi:hypothetical protein
MNSKVANNNIDSIPKFSMEKISEPQSQSQEEYYFQCKYPDHSVKNINLNISAFDTNNESLNFSKEFLNKSSNTNNKFSGFRNSMFDIPFMNSGKKNFKSIFNFFDDENLIVELEQRKKRKSNQINLDNNKLLMNLSSFKLNEMKNNNEIVLNENSNFSLDKKDLNELINDLENNESKYKRNSHFSNFNLVVNEEENDDSNFSDFDSDINENV